MSSKWLISAIVLNTALAYAQVEGRFYLEKDTYASGEPVFLYFEVTNGKSAVQIPNPDPYTFCSGYDIRVSSDPGRNNSCGAKGFAGSCMAGIKVLKSGEKYSQRILLNYQHRIDADGHYDVDAHKILSYGAPGDYSATEKPFLDIRMQLHFRVDASVTVDPATVKGITEQLRSSDQEKRRDAVITLVSVAPASMEDAVIALASNSDEQLRQFAPLGLHRLNTARTRATMAELVKKEPGTYANLKSAEFLAESGDAEWFALLLEMAEKKPKLGNYVWAAAESGGDKAFPLLFKLMRSGDSEYEVPIGITGFGYTGSRAAVPILLDLLKSPDLSTSSRALAALRDLTHMSIEGDRWADNPQGQYSKWVRWWNENGATARIYKPYECGDFSKLN